MRLIFDDPTRPQDVFVIEGTNVTEGETFEVDEDYGHYLLDTYPLRLKRVPELIEVVIAAKRDETRLR